MRQYANFVLTLLLLASVPASAHDIGISKTELTETTAGSYRLRVLAKPSVTTLFPSPQLPGHCEFAELPRGVQGSVWKTFEFNCENGLKPDDTLLLPGHHYSEAPNATMGETKAHNPYLRIDDLATWHNIMG